MSATRNGASRKRKEQPITAGEALEILQSALSYCQRAGLTVNYSNTAHGLTLYLPCAAVMFENDAARLVVGEAQK